MSSKDEPSPSSSSTSTSTSTSSPSPPEGGPWDQKTSEKFESKSFSKFFDPCQEAADRSLKCLHRNGGDRDMCVDYFQAYRDCKKQWVSRGLFPV
ncbi:Cytochrome c oxidase-assembly factor cox-23, mitochondrial [Lachnellula willkommii]|uniref:Cytochrome c oxidase-assembly factor cox-23, mitochondrial n=1 Tax=Lachnellula willkommii TaxID=215461 RepID=A0A559MEU3_9HELO|nr:Cytochrome c oxidase-assembly factor cox-23, mitochondrial [Lachnellula willkommii]